MVDALVCDLGSLDVILGIAWLGRLGDVIFNWQKQEIRFWDSGDQVILRGSDSSLELASLQECLDVQTDPIQPLPPATMSLDPLQQSQLQEILSQFSTLFSEPTGLPPKRRIEHKINLIEGQGQCVYALTDTRIYTRMRFSDRFMTC